MSKEVGLTRKLKLAIGKSKSSKNSVKTEDKRKKGNEGDKRVQGSNHNMVDSAIDHELHKRKNGGKKNFKSGANEGEVEGRGCFGPGNSDRKRKRIYADRGVSQDVESCNVDVPIRKSIARKVQYPHDGDDSVEKKRSTKGKSCDGELHNRKFSSTRGRNSLNDKLIEGKCSKRELRPSRVYNKREDIAIDGKRSFRRVEDNRRNEELSDNKLKTKVKTIDRQPSAKLGSGQDTLLKKHGNGKMNLRKPVDTRQTTYQAGSVEKTSKKMLPDRKGLDGDRALTNDRPKRKKRVIRIDPYDISNKRLDDGISINGNDENTIQKKVDLEKDVELSKNAQFRAIQPTPSILSFVEDNLLGRRRLIELQRSGYNTKLPVPLDNIPASTSSERERIEEAVFRNKLTFFAAAKISSSFPPADLPEIAFAGRSNVGKSSLLNALTRQWGVVRTSDKPGLTQTINFFNLGSKLCLVDLPGYGFAYAKEEVKDAWEELVKEYVSTRVGLKRVCLLIDTKWGMKPRDHELINLMERSHTKYQIVLTKSDVVFPIDVARRAMQIEENLKANKSMVQPVMMASSKSGAGIRSLRTVLAKITRFAKL